MKRILSMFILIGMLILPLLFPLTASAEVTTLSTSVPQQATLSVEIIGKGTVTVNNTSTRDNAKFLVDRLVDVNVFISANSNHSLKAVYLNGTDVTADLKNSLLTIENIQFDTNLVIKFAPKGSGYSVDVPFTGDTFHLYAMLLCLLGSLIMLIILFLGKRKKKL